MAHNSSQGSDKFSKFDISETPYKVVNNQDIRAYVLTPKTIIPGSHPIIVEFHGGFLITGASLYAEWYPQWDLDYTLLHSAIVVTGDYRLLPESTGADIVEDVSDFWEWVRNDLQRFLDKVKPGVEADLSKIIVHGGSAGGTLALISGLSQPKGFIKAVIATYPGMNTVVKRTKPILGLPIFPASVLEDHLRAMQPGKIVTSAFPPARFDICMGIVQQDLKPKFLGDNENIYPLKVVAKSASTPYTLIIHGEDDSAVLVATSIEYTEVARKKFGDGLIDLHVEPGKEHGFDGEVPLNTPWLEERLAKVTEVWLGRNDS